MIITNKMGLPESLVNAVKNHNHVKADYSASQMLKSPRMVHLENRHKDEISEDVSDRIWSLFGSAVHAILETGESENQLVEEYFIEEIGGVKLSGMSDLYDNKIVYDWKVTSAWSYVFRADKIEEWKSQLNIYAWFFRKQEIHVDGLKIVMILRDWQRSKALYDPNYPQAQVVTVDIPLISDDEIESFIKQRIRIYEETKSYGDNELPECTDSERWVKPSKFAVMKKGRKSAIKICDTEEQAHKYMADTGKGEYTEERKAELWKRCEYCSASAFCNQYIEGKK